MSEAAAPHRLRVLVALPDLSGGGAQGVLLTLAGRLGSLGVEMGVVAADGSGVLRRIVPKEVQFFDLNVRKLRRAGPGLVRAVWQFRPDVILSSVYHMNHLVLALRPLLPAATRIVVREAIMPRSALPSWSHPWIRRGLYRALYPTADRIVVQCAAMGAELAELFSVPHDRMVRIWNPSPPPLSPGEAHVFEGPGPHVVAAGRVVPQKGFDRLVAAFPALLERERDAELWILGDCSGAHAQEIRALADRLGIARSVHLVGFQSAPRRWFAAADLFVLSSRYEGLPNVLIEALQSGCPVVALRGAGGTAELLAAAGLSDRLVEALTWDPGWFRGAGSQPPVSADLSAFDPDRITAEYLGLLQDVTRAAPGAQGLALRG